MNKRITAVTAAAVMALSAGGFSVPAYAERPEKWPTPISDVKGNKDVKAFKAAKPKLSMEEYEGRYYFERTFTWTKVDNALLYYVYKKDDSSKTFRLVGKTLDNSYSIPNEDASYKVRAVTYDYSDELVMGALSDPLKVRSVDTIRPVYDEIYEEEAEEESGAVYYTANSAAPSVSYRSDSLGFVPAPVPHPDKNTEEYSHYDDNGYRDAAKTPLSTFSADVDTASYANVRRMTETGRIIPSDAVRIEEFVNYFDYNYTKPTGDKPFSVDLELSDCPWNKNAQLMSVGIQARPLDKEPSSNLVFLIDVSGSMYSDDKLPLVVDSIQELTKNLTANDRVSIVTYSGEERVVLAGAKGNQINAVTALTDLLEASGSTNGESGINMAYEIAENYFIEGANNRVIMATDGDLNVGISDKDELAKFIEKKRDTGVYLTVLGFGTGNIKDNKMEALAKEGNGNYYYIDSETEAEKVLVKEKNGTLVTVADDVKIQVEFNPDVVSQYRLIGYDSRRLENEDFDNDAKDAADVGAGQSVTVLYEIIPAKGQTKGLKYQKSTGNKNEICTMSIRYKDPGETDSKKLSYKFRTDTYVPFAKADPRLRVSASAAMFAMSLREDGYGTDVTAEQALKILKDTDKKDLEQVGYSDDLMKLIEKHINNTAE
ncbi:MAG: von Willebrand factor type A domain-containing protein [Oscillospiraceae bacterium]|nr:von Willebrand factor type A domain-containing protein [Oscillospiraceae bacterium]